MEPKIVQGVGTAVLHSHSHARRIAAAMRGAVLDAVANNVPLDSLDLNDLMLAARDTELAKDL